MPVKVCFVILGIDFSGAENVLYQYLDGNAEIDPFFVFIYDGKAYEKFQNLQSGDRCINLEMPYHKNELRILPELAQEKIIKRLINVVDRLRPDVVYANNTLETMLCGLAVKKMNTPAFGHIHDMCDAYGTPMKVRATRKVLANYNKVFTVSEACKASWGAPALEVVYNGIPDRYYTEYCKKEETVGFTVGYVGMLCRRKGTDLLFDVIKNHADCRWHIAYNLVKDGMEQYVEEWKKSNNVFIENNVKPDDMPAFYDSIDLLVIPSRQDPLPTVAIEAMARHKLVVGFRIGGIPELIGDDRLIIDEISSSSLEEKIDEIRNWTEEKRTQIEENLHRRAKEKFSQENKRARINSALNDALHADKVIR